MEFYGNNRDDKWDRVFSCHKCDVWFRKKPSGNKGDVVGHNGFGATLLIRHAKNGKKYLMTW